MEFEISRIRYENRYESAVPVFLNMMYLHLFYNLTRQELLVADYILFSEGYLSSRTYILVG